MSQPSSAADEMNQFVEATVTVFTTMLGCRPKKAKAAGPVRDEGVLRTAIIGLSGTVRGAVALAFPADTAHFVVKRLMGTDSPVTDDQINDAIGEVANMVAGSAKSKLVGQDVSISLPSVVRGHKYTILHPKDSVTFEVPFESELGGFTLNVTFSKPKADRAREPRG